VPLTLEPPKLCYIDPVVVVDFQSLYPSVMIAYNLCYSTCLGKYTTKIDENGNKKFIILRNNFLFVFCIN